MRSRVARSGCRTLPDSIRWTYPVPKSASASTTSCGLPARSRSARSRAPPSGRGCLLDSPLPATRFDSGVNDISLGRAYHSTSIFVGHDTGGYMSAIVVSGYVPGAIGRVTELHGTYYAAHWDLGLFFEAKAATELSALLSRFDTTRDGFWVARDDELIVGAIAIDGSDAAG